MTVSSPPRPPRPTAHRAPPPPTEEPHPRIRARRIGVRRDEGRRRLHLVAILGVVLALVLAGAGLTRSPVLDVDRISVVGALRTPRAEVLAASGVHTGDAMVDVDGEAVRERLRRRLPWVGRVSVQRRWPATVRVRLWERSVAAQVALPGGRWALVDRTGRVLEHRDEPAAGLVALEGSVPGPPGPPGSSLGRGATPALTVASAFSSRVRAAVVAVRTARVGGGTTLALVLADLVVVRFGPPSEVAAKLVALDAMVTSVDRRCVATIDVRVPSAPVLTRRPACA